MMGAELDALRDIADKLIRSDPLVPETWDLDLSGCLPIAKTHLHSWSGDVGDLEVSPCEYALTQIPRNKVARTVVAAVKVD
jgi:hypothetical protein